MWYSVESCADVSGATLCVLPDRAWLIGGNTPLAASLSTKGGKTVPPPLVQQATEEQVTSTKVLQISAMELPSATWKATLVNTHGHRNRLGHASAAIAQDRVLIFGGIVAGAGNAPELAEEILVVQDSLFGLTVSAARPGQGAELSLYLHTDLSIEGVSSSLVDLEVEGPKPPGRAFHTCVLGGPGGGLLMLFGGQSSTGELLGDLWVCDVSEVVGVLRRAMALADAATGRGESKGEGEEGAGNGEAEAEASPLKLPPVQWKCLQETSNTAAPRARHGSYSYNSTVEDSDPPAPCVKMCVLGGTRSGVVKGGVCGDWRSGTRNGLGRHVAPNNDTYEGKWVGGKRWKGRWQSSTGLEYYDGFWDLDKPHGLGVRGYANGDVWEGQWDHGVRIDGSDFGNTADAKQWGNK